MESIINQINKDKLSIAYLKNMNFDKLSRQMMNKKLLTNYELFFKQIYEIFEKKYEPKKTKIILSSLMINYHSIIVFSKNNQYNDKIKEVSSKLCEGIEQIQSNNEYLDKKNLEIFINYLGLYLSIFNVWKKRDKTLLLDDLVLLYFETECLHINEKINIELNPNFEETIKNQKEGILKKIRMIGGEDGMKYFNTQKELLNLEVKNLKNLKENITNIVYNSYWDSIKSSLESDPPNTQCIISLLKDIVGMLIDCVPNRTDLHYKIVNCFDLKHLENMIATNNVDDVLIIDYTDKVIFWIEEFISKEDKVKFLDWKKKLVKLNDEKRSNYYKNTINLPEYISNYFRYMITLIDKIYNDANEFRQTDLYNTLKIKNENKN